MRVKRISLDTNMLVYALDRDAGERHTLAVDVLDQAVESDCILTTQALSEFFHVVTRKNGMPAKDAAQQVQDWMVLFPVVSALPAAVSTAMSLVVEHCFSFWDALLVATVKEAGVSHLLTEDMEAGRAVLGVRLINPFTEAWLDA
ncbi:MAG: PIN domain-containing protein [Acidithiobacillus sp.]